MDQTTYERRIAARKRKTKAKTGYFAKKAKGRDRKIEARKQTKARKWHGHWRGKEHKWAAKAAKWDQKWAARQRKSPAYRSLQTQRHVRGLSVSGVDVARGKTGGARRRGRAFVSGTGVIQAELGGKGGERRHGRKSISDVLE